MCFESSKILRNSKVQDKKFAKNRKEKRLPNDSSLISNLINVKTNIILTI